MPSTVADVFAAAGVPPAGVVRWHTAVPQPKAGVYVVALTDDIASMASARADAPIDPARLENLLAVRPELLLDGGRPTAAELVDRLRRFWLADEVVLYIGLASRSVRTRVGQYYKTPLGARRPHAGGWWLKTLSVLDELSVHFAASPDFSTAEGRALRAWASAVSSRSRGALHDRELVAPFANLRTASGAIKAHGITGATGGLSGGPEDARPAATRSTVRPHAAKPAARPKLAGDAHAVSQRVTARDVSAGQVRFPRAAKTLFPPERALVDAVLRGREMRGRWDPRVGPDRERSGVLAFGRGKLDGVVSADDVLMVRVRGDGRVVLE